QFRVDNNHTTPILPARFCELPFGFCFQFHSSLFLSSTTFTIKHHQCSQVVSLMDAEQLVAVESATRILLRMNQNTCLEWADSQGLVTAQQTFNRRLRVPVRHQDNQVSLHTLASCQLNTPAANRTVNCGVPRHSRRAGCL